MEELLELLKKKVLDYPVKGSFRVTVERRGWKGVINSHEWATQLGALIHEETGAPVDLEQPDTELVIEIMQDSCGIALISKETRSKYFFTRTK